jgi:hypothetical protein
MLTERRSPDPPQFSLCIPQYNRTNFLIAALESYASQTLRDFEVCISDDRSTDGGRERLLNYLDRSGVAYAYRVRDTNGRYDANLRSAIALARGRYCLLMGNDDALAGPTSLAELSTDLQKHPGAGVVITNYADWTTAVPNTRVKATRNYGAGPAVAAEHFRNFSFVSGVLLERETAQGFATARWDGSEMYQMYLGCKMIASGWPLLELDRVLVRKDVQVPGEAVDSYARKPRVWPCPLVERPLPFNQLTRLVADAIAPYCRGATRQRLNERVLRQVLQFTYPIWLVEYRKVQSWRYAAGVALGMRPRRIFDGIDLSPTHRCRAAGLYCLATLAGMTVPIGLVRRLQDRLYRLAKSVRR